MHTMRSTIPCPLLFTVAGVLMFASVAAAAPYYQESGGTVAFEGEGYQSTTPSQSTPPTTWATRSAFEAEASGGAFIQALPDDGTSAGDFSQPTAEYDFRISGASGGSTFNFYARMEGPDSGGDSISGRLFRLDEAGGETEQIAEDGQIDTEDGGGFAYEDGFSGLTLSEDLYRLRLFAREDGASVDHLVLTTDELAESSTPPPNSPLAPEPASAFMLAVGAGLLLPRRRARKGRA